MMAMQQQMQTMGGGNPMAWDAQKAFDAERAALGLVRACESPRCAGHGRLPVTA